SFSLLLLHRTRLVVVDHPPLPLSVPRQRLEGDGLQASHDRSSKFLAASRSRALAGGGFSNKSLTNWLSRSLSLIRSGRPEPHHGQNRMATDDDPPSWTIKPYPPTFGEKWIRQSGQSKRSEC